MERHVGLVSLVGLALFAMLTGGCAKILGVGDYGVGGAKGTSEAGPTAAPIVITPPACSSCTEKQCTAERRACDGDAACRKQAACYYGCSGNHLCEYGCLSKGWSAASSSALKVLHACTVDRCTAACVTCAAPFVGQSGTCGDCAEQDRAPSGICDRSNTCMRDEQCRGYLACLATECDELGESDPKCRLVCGAKFPDGARSFYQNVGTRYLGNCAAACDAGNHWRCPQRPPAWPPASGADTHLTLRLAEGAVLHGDAASVRACNARDFKCATPLATLPADAATEVRFVIPTSTTLVSTPVNKPAVFFDNPIAGQFFAPQQPFVGDLILWWPNFSATDSSGLASAAAVRRESIDLAEHGLVQVVVADCDGGVAGYSRQSAATRVTVTASPGSAPYYGGSAGPTEGGVAWFIISMPADSTSVEISVGGTPIQSADVPVRAGTTTVVSFNYPQWL
jgi:hypothetical protein